MRCFSVSFIIKKPKNFNYNKKNQIIFHKANCKNNKIIENLIPLFEKAGIICLELRRQGLKKEIKEDNTPVTNGDIKVNNLITNEIKKITPEIPIVSEEVSTNKTNINLKIRINKINKHRLFASLLIVFIGIISSDILFHYFYPEIILQIENLFGLEKETHDAVDLTFAPEIWGGVLATVLGTLIIVIAIAAESTPKLMDLFVKDWVSLLFIWF